MKTIDNRGLNCPEPLLRTRQALQKNSELISLVDNEAARENILRYAKNLGYTVNWEGIDNYFAITITGSTSASGLKATSRPEYSIDPGTVIMITGNLLGQGSNQLGELLMRNFIFTLTKRRPLPGIIILMNTGVKFSIAGSPVLEELQQLAQQGVKILSCGTCLDFYKLTEKLAVGEITNMYDTADIISSAARTITI